jgi:hypothetical protein
MTGDLLTDLKLSVEYEAAKVALAGAKQPGDLVSAWWGYCDKFDGPPREELRRLYTEQLRRLGALVG